MSAPESVTITLPPPGCWAESPSWERVAAVLRTSGYVSLDDIADQIEAQLPKPKPEEPKGLGAVVRTGRGDRWVRVDPDTDHNVRAAWESEYGPGKVRWSDFDDAVEILSEGVTA